MFVWGTSRVFITVGEEINPLPISTMIHQIENYSQAFFVFTKRMIEKRKLETRTLWKVGFNGGFVYIINEDIFLNRTLISSIFSKYLGLDEGAIYSFDYVDCVETLLGEDGYNYYFTENGDFVYTLDNTRFSNRESTLINFRDLFED